MNTLRNHLSVAILTVVGAMALWHGPIAQLPNYHAFADQSARYGIPHFADVISNLGFALVALWGACVLSRSAWKPALMHGRGGYRPSHRIGRTYRRHSAGRCCAGIGKCKRVSGGCYGVVWRGDDHARR